jgi:uncharacterized protein YndB with AHSA1/START domain
MAIDVARVISTVTRKLSTRDQDGSPARLLVATRTYDTTREDLWGALTHPERIPRWFLPISGDLRRGGTYQLEGNAGGEILACEPPARLGLTWGMHGQVSWVTVKLSDNPGGGAVLQLEHLAHVPEELWQHYGPGAVGVGWDQALLGLDRHCATGETVDPEAAAAWLSSEEGRSFVHLSSQAWCEASIAAGMDPETARSAAARTTAFYVGAEPGVGSAAS